MGIVVTGSVAFDNIMNFPGYFKDHILPDKVHMLSVAFLVDDLRRQDGGAAANVAYNLALLGERPAVLACVGTDFAEYRARLDARGVDTTHIHEVEGAYTAGAFITTDKDDNQITGFYPGAMGQAGSLPLDAMADADLVVITPDAPDAMTRYPQVCRDRGIDYIYCPGQQTPALSDEDIIDAVTGARAIIGNDYEMELIASKTGRRQEDLIELTATVITTLGDRGSSIRTTDGEVTIPVAPARQVNDPTGAGDAFLAGVAFGIRRGDAPERYGKIAALSATHAVEQHGTQEHAHDPASFAERFREAFGEDF